MQTLDGLGALVRPVGAGLVHGERGPDRIVGQHDLRRQLLHRRRPPGDFRGRGKTGQPGRRAPGRPVVAAAAVVEVVDCCRVGVAAAHVGEKQPEAPVRLPEQTGVEFFTAAQNPGNCHLHRCAPGTGRHGGRRPVQLAPRRPLQRSQRGGRAAAEGGLSQPRSVDRQGQEISRCTRRKRGQGERSVISGRVRLGTGNGSGAVAHPRAASLIGSRRDRAAQVLGADLAAQRIDLDLIHHGRRGQRRAPGICLVANHHGIAVLRHPFHGDRAGGVFRGRHRNPELLPCPVGAGGEGDARSLGDRLRRSRHCHLAGPATLVLAPVELRGLLRAVRRHLQRHDAVRRAGIHPASRRRDGDLLNAGQQVARTGPADRRRMDRQRLSGQDAVLEEAGPVMGKDCDLQIVGAAVLEHIGQSQTAVRHLRQRQVIERPVSAGLKQIRIVKLHPVGVGICQLDRPRRVGDGIRRFILGIDGDQTTAGMKQACRAGLVERFGVQPLPGKRQVGGELSRLDLHQRKPAGALLRGEQRGAKHIGHYVISSRRISVIATFSMYSPFRSKRSAPSKAVIFTR